jgi:Flp pilus assembly protein TadG
MSATGLVSSRRGPSSEGGTALVETAIVLPLLLLLIMGIIDLGRYLAVRQEITHATREAVRVYAVTQNEQWADDAFTGGTAGLTCDEPTITPTPCTAGEPVTVTGSCDYSSATPLGTWLGLDTGVGSKAVMRCGG